MPCLLSAYIITGTMNTYICILFTIYKTVSIFICQLICMDWKEYKNNHSWQLWIVFYVSSSCTYLMLCFVSKIPAKICCIILDKKESMTSSYRLKEIIIKEKFINIIAVFCLLFIIWRKIYKLDYLESFFQYFKHCQ